MKNNLTLNWVEQVKRLQAPGEDLKYEEHFTQLKNQNGSLTPDAAWMLGTAETLLQRSLDWRVCIYALHAAAIAGEPESFVNVMKVFAYIACDKFNESYPSGHQQKMATLVWCNGSYIVDHLKAIHSHFTEAQYQEILGALTQITQAILTETGEGVKWHSLDEFLMERLKKADSPRPLVKTEEAAVTLPSEEMKHSREARPFFDKMIVAMLKEKQYERAISLSRAHRWSPLVVPKDRDGKTELEIRQQAIDRVQHKFDQGDWETVVIESENLFLQLHAHYWMKINYWSYISLMHIGEKSAAECLLMHLKKLYRNYGQILNLMYNSGQLFADPETQAWINQLCHEPTLLIHEGGSEKDPQWIMDKDVASMKSWLQENSVNNKKESFIHDYLHLKILKNERVDLNLGSALCALFNRSVEENLHAWEPKIAEKIWAFYAEQLKEEKKQMKQNHLSLWQDQWEHLTRTTARIHLPAALQLMKQS